MTDVRAFRALRYRPERVGLGAVVAPPLEGLDAAAVSALVARDPRNVVRLARTREEPGDGVDAGLQRAAFLIAEWRRAGVLARDTRPAIYALRRPDVEGETRMGFYARVPVRGTGTLVVDDLPNGASGGALLRALRTAVEPVVLSHDDDAGRVQRALAVELDREPDVVFSFVGVAHELWIVDDDTTLGRVAALLATAALRVVSGREAWAAHVSAALELSDVDDDAPTAARHALAFIVGERSRAAFTRVPMGTVLASLEGAL